MIKNKNLRHGITLIALIITIIVLLILAGVVISMTIGKDGIIEKAQVAATLNNKAAAEEKVNFAVMTSYDDNGKRNNDLLKENINKIEGLDEEVEEVEFPLIIIVDRFQFSISETWQVTYEGEIDISDKTKYLIINNPGLIGKVSKINQSGYSNIQIKGKTSSAAEEETVNLDVHTIVYKGDMLLNGVNTFEGITYDSQNKTYFVGDKTRDVATASSDAQYTVVLKVIGNLTINPNIYLTACRSDNGYGGPKGFIIFCTETLQNNGEITMTARGARAAGQNIYLYKNAHPIENQNKFEFIPKDGANGGARNGSGRNVGDNGVNRQTAGGGSGRGSSGYYGGAGTAGTSYSGGTSGSGGSSNTGYGNDGSPNGGAGATGKGFSGGGAGNPGGTGGNSGDHARQKGSDGTGGTLIIFGKSVHNNATISSNGLPGGRGGNNDSNTAGGSGGGSINIFYQEEFIKGNIYATGGSTSGSGAGGTGGTGAISCGSVSSGTYVSTFRNY